MRRIPLFGRHAAIAAVLASAVAGCGRDEGPSPEAGTSVAVTVQPARTEPIRDVVIAPGTVVPASSGDFTVVAVEPVTIVELPKKEGDAVQTGDVLARFDVAAIAEELTTRQLELAAAKTKADAARAEAARNSSLFERGLVSRNQMETARMAAADADSALAEAQARIDALKAQEHRTIVRARFPGIVSKIWHVNGDYVSIPGEPVLRVIDPNKVQVLMQVPLSDFQRVLPGQPATIQSPVGGPPATATVVMRTPPADPAAATAEVRLDLQGAHGLTVESLVQVEILVDERVAAITIPASAVQRNGTAAFVWIAGDDGAAHRRDVTLGIVSGGRAQITSGVANGERVILTGVAELTDGAAIRVG